MKRVLLMTGTAAHPRVPGGHPTERNEAAA